MGEDVNARNSTVESEKLLQEAHMRKVKEHIPLIAVLITIAVVGIVGNILTIIFYGFKVKMKKSSTVVLITLLAILDLIVCFLCFTTIADLFVNILYTDVILCKVMYFFDHWFVVSSVFALWIIAIDRYRRMCKPLGKQLTVKSAVAAVIVTSSFSMLFSTHDFLTYSPVKLNISTSDDNIPFVTGHYCTNTDNPKLQTVVVVFHILDALTIFACLATFVFTYGNIWLALRKHNRNTVHLHTRPNASLGSLRQSTSDFNSKIHQSEEDITEEPATSSSLIRNQSVHFSIGSDINAITLNASAAASSLGSTEKNLYPTNKAAQIRRSSKPSKTRRSERNVTIMMFAVTVGFVVCFTPYFIVNVGIRVSSETTESELRTGIEFALRTPFWNSVINPIIFCVFNTQYRRYIKDIFTKCQVNKATINTSSC